MYLENEKGLTFDTAFINGVPFLAIVRPKLLSLFAVLQQVFGGHCPRPFQAPTPLNSRPGLPYTHIHDMAFFFQ